MKSSEIRDLYFHEMSTEELLHLQSLLLAELGSRFCGKYQLSAYMGEGKLELVKTLRMIMGLGLREAKDLADNGGTIRIVSPEHGQILEEVCDKFNIPLKKVS